jgi:predicted nuclease of restriction endonuclease-like (RecB) superfamily
LKRSFYEVETVKNNWKMRELRRAINTLLFERTGLSTNKGAVIAKVNAYSGKTGPVILE